MQTPDREEILQRLTDLEAGNFEAAAQLVFDYQRAHNPLYRRFLELLGDKGIRPFLPISLFKNYNIKSGDWATDIFFQSSGTTGQIASKHWVRDLDWYLQNARNGFAQRYGDPSEWCFLALLPNYLERGNSSLVAMVDHFIKLSQHPESGFFLDDFQALQQRLTICQSKGYKTILLGVSFALLDFSEQFPMPLPEVIVMETGGMKGRRKELTRPELHQALQQALHPAAIHSEYGMTELFSQAYATGGTIFAPAPTMRVVTTELNDPFCVLPAGRTGVLNIIDLANLDTISFIQTEDIGKVHEDGRFEILGRLDAAELRGCNLMVEGGR